MFIMPILVLPLLSCVAWIVSLFWYIYHMRQGHFDQVNRKLHAKYAGPVVRIAPNEVSIDSAEAVHVIYSTRPERRFTKTDFYTAGRPAIASKHENLFMDLDEDHHAARRRIVANVYSMSSILESEPQTLLLLPASLRKPYMATGLLYKSVKQAIVDNAKRVTYARELVYKRMSELKNNGGTAESKGRRDLLSKMFEISATKGDKVDFHLPEIEMESWVNIQAGVDTTAIALQAILYHILKDARVHQKLLSELDAALRNQRIAIPIKYSDALKLPYLSACIKEAMRLHPSVGLQLPRHPPPEGCHISGYYFPHSARVGVNAAVLHYNQDVFGEDASSFRPERWSESNAAEMDVSIFLEIIV
ncbi:Cytochrome P450 monooxygenase [Pseudocercospora fuligena]|uniref:Cytochrome P450 monooxygenase n=1 Tax=Pseudocercospora fuligena TaxID=685502 RepID=A0A8H6VEB3_9PEZI|nr:Cytochrome P450 monooxygenase [Pseudocercospora fuligena]